MLQLHQISVMRRGLSVSRAGLALRTIYQRRIHEVDAYFAGLGRRDVFGASAKRLYAESAEHSGSQVPLHLR
jgi:hypothetical protein